MTINEEKEWYSKHTLEEKADLEQFPFKDQWRGGLLGDAGAILYILSPYNVNLSILDVGVGTGWLSWILAMSGHTVLGIDFSKDWINLSKRRFKHPNLTYKCVNYETYKFDHLFDAIVMHDALHHAPDEYKWIKRAYNLLKDGGVLVTSEPGTGHAANPETKKVVDRFHVTEKDMPVGYIVEMGQKAGFKDAIGYPSAKFVMELMYLRRYECTYAYKCDTGMVKLIK